MPSIIHSYPDPGTVITAAVGLITREIAQAVDTRGRAWAALSGGETPRALYERLAATHSRLPWDRIWWCFGDERWVPHQDALSNFHMVERALFSRAPVPRDHIVAVPTDAPDPVAGARAYETTLRAEWPGAEWPELDVVVMGLGADGHTASLFPGDRALDERAAWATSSRAGRPVPDRVTLTVPVFSRARVMIFLVTGAFKADAVSATLTGPSEPAHWPAQAVVPGNGRCVWLLDRAAAAKLPPDIVHS